MKIAVIGATGFVGSHIVSELAARDHQVMAISRKGIQEGLPDNVKAVAVDVNDVSKLEAIIRGNEVLISAFNAGWTNPNIYEDFLKGAKNIQQATKQAEIKRLIIVGGAGSLLVDGNKVIDNPNFPESARKRIQATNDYLDIIRQEDELDWTFFSPALEMGPRNPGVRTGKYRLGLDTPVFDEKGRSYISVADVGVVLADEAENPKHIKQRFTAGY